MSSAGGGETKTVQFKDGRYGIRKLTILGYRFLGSDISEDYWWGAVRENVPTYAAMSREKVIDRWKRFPLKRQRKIWDNGDVVKTKGIRMNGGISKNILVDFY